MSFLDTVLKDILAHQKPGQPFVLICETDGKWTAGLGDKATKAPGSDMSYYAACNELLRVLDGRAAKRDAVDQARRSRDIIAYELRLSGKQFKEIAAILSISSSRVQELFERSDRAALHSPEYLIQAECSKEYRDHAQSLAAIRAKYPAGPKSRYGKYLAERAAAGE